MKKQFTLTALFVAMFLMPLFCYSQNLVHFVVTPSTGINCTVVVPVSANPTVNGAPLVYGDEIAIFNAAGVCCGARAWNGTSNRSITVWGEVFDPVYLPGMSYGAPFLFRVWKTSTNTEYSNMVATFSTGTGTYITSSLQSVATLISSNPTPPPPVLVYPANGATGIEINPNLLWNASTGATSYDVVVASDAAYTNILFSSYAQTGLNFQLNGLSYGMIYYWKVRAHNSAGYSAWTTANFTTVPLLLPPVLVSPANNATNQPGNTLLEWQPAVGAVSYYFEVSTDPCFSSYVANGIITTTSYQLTGLIANTQYYWKVMSISNTQTSAFTSVWTFTTAQLVHFVVTTNTGNSCTVLVPLTANPTWNGQPLEYGDEIGIYNSNGVCCGAKSWNGTQNRSITVWGEVFDPIYLPGMTTGETFIFRIWRASQQTEYTPVFVTYALGNGTYSIGSLHRLGSLESGTPPQAPELVYPANNAIGIMLNPDLQWNASLRTNNYDVQVSDDAIFSNILFSSTTQTGLTYQLYNLNVNTVYYWRVRSNNLFGNSSWTSASFTTVFFNISIGLIQYWNMISSNIAPANTDLDWIFGPLGSNFVLAKDNVGNVYWPEWGINDIGNWDITQGYQAFVFNAGNLVIYGDSINPNQTPINLTQSWNMIAYLSDIPLSPDVALTSIQNNLVYVKDNLGNTYFPEWGIDDIGLMLPGQGYQIYMNQSGVLIYP